MKTKQAHIVINCRGEEEHFYVEYDAHVKLVKFLQRKCVLGMVDENDDELSTDVICQKCNTIAKLNEQMEECVVREIKSFKLLK